MQIKNAEWDDVCTSSTHSQFFILHSQFGLVVPLSCDRFLLLVGRVVDRRSERRE
jgi:hypothetical protein